MKKLLQFTLLAFVLVACGANNTEEAKEAKDMADFADDKEFQEAHETPAEIDFSGKGQKISFATTDGKEALAYLVPATEKRADNKYLFVIHEWYGLNDFIKRESERLAEAMPDVSVMALDLYDGKVASTREKASEYMQAVQDERAQAIIAGAMGQVGSGAKIATIGWCFGGGWSLRAAIQAGPQAKACVMYYGMPVQEAVDLAPLRAPVLGIFATNDAWINPEVAGNFEKLANATGKQLTVKTYEADHGFANPSSPRYDETAAQEANASSLEFLKQYLQ